MYKSTTSGPGQGLSRFKNPQPPAGDPKREPGKPSAPPRRDAYVTAAAGQIVVIASKGGLVFTGLLSLDSPPGLLRLQNVTIKSREGTYSVPWALLDRQQVSHLHPVPTEPGAT